MMQKVFSSVNFVTKFLGEMMVPKMYLRYNVHNISAAKDDTGNIFQNKITRLSCIRTKCRFRFLQYFKSEKFVQPCLKECTAVIPKEHAQFTFSDMVSQLKCITSAYTMFLTANETADDHFKAPVQFWEGSEISPSNICFYWQII